MNEFRYNNRHKLLPVLRAERRRARRYGLLHSVRLLTERIEAIEESL